MIFYLFLFRNQFNYSTCAQMMENSAMRLMCYLLEKLEHEPVRSRAQLCDDLAFFLPDEAICQKLKDQASMLREMDRQMQLLKSVISRKKHQ